MFWVGRLNAVLAIVAFAGLVLMWATSGVQAALGWLLVMGVIRIGIRILDIVWTAITGNPLFYDTKILDNRRGEGE